LTDANLFTRLRHVDRANYYQVQGIKRIVRASVSADYTKQDLIHVVRAALSVDTAGSVLIDRIRFENYARVRPDPAYGYAITVQRHVTRRLMAGGGLSDIDEGYGTLNSDLNRTGRRVYASISRRIGSAWLGSAQVARVLGSEPFAGPRTRVDFALGLDVLRALPRNSANPR
jgi:hypothetical protein